MAEEMYDYYEPVWGSPYMQPFVWLVLIGLIFAAGVGFAMGANDVANSFGTSVAARVVSLYQACFLAGLFNFLGAMVLGGEVTDTIKSGIVELKLFKDTPSVYMSAMAAAYIGTFTLVMVATYYKMPVSTTHAVVGGVLGSSLAAYSNEGVNWFEFGMVVVGWIAAPVFAGIFTATFYLMQQRIVHREPDVGKAKTKQVWFAAFQVGLIAWMLTFFVLTKVAEDVPDYLQVTKLKKDHGPPTWPGSLLLPLVCFAAMFGVMILSRFFLIPAIFSAVERDHNSNGEIKDVDEADAEVKELQHYTENGEAADAKKPPCCDVKDMFTLNHENKPYALQKHVRKQAEKYHASADDYPREIEIRFKGIQIISASFMALSHGANDIANVIGPVAGELEAFKHGTVDKKAPTNYAILAFGGMFIVLGLLLYGARVMATIGHNTTKITPSRGVNVEIGAGFAVTIASYLGIPVSTTQCVMGSVIAVGLCNKENVKTIDLGLFGLIFVTWVLTPLVSGLIAAASFELFNALADSQVPDDFFPLNDNSTVYGRHYDFGL